MKTLCQDFMGLQFICTGDADVQQRVQAAGPHERRVEQVRPVGGADHEQVACAGA